MKKILNVAFGAIIAVSFIGLPSCATSDKGGIPHKGSKQLNSNISQLDSINIDAIDTSTQGNFVMCGDSLYFADARNYGLHLYNLNGEYLGKKLREGQGPNELSNLLYAANLSNSSDSIVLIDRSVKLYIYDTSKDSLMNLGNVDFGWSEEEQDYDSPGAYNVMEMTDFGITFLKKENGNIVFPVSIIKRLVGDKVDEDRYKKGHIFGNLAVKNMKVDSVFGQFPPFMLENPTPGFEFFDYAYDAKNRKYYVSFATDPNLYCLNDSGEIEYSFGEDAPDVRRTYTIGYNDPSETFGKDIQDGQIGCNTGVMYVADKNLVLRTTLLDFASGRVTLQGYRDGNMILEKEMPPYFKLLGYSNGEFIGCRFLPVEIDENTIAFRIYKFKVN